MTGHSPLKEVSNWLPAYSPAERRAQAEAERRAKHEAEQRIKEAAERDRLAALAMAKEEAVRHHGAPAATEETGRPGKKKG